MKRVAGPLLLFLGSSSFFAYEYLKGTVFLKRSQPEIYSHFQKLKGEDLEERASGLRELLKYVHKNTRVRKRGGEDFNERADILYDVGCVKLVNDLLHNPSAQTSEILCNCFKLLRALLKGERRDEPKKRAYYLRLGLLKRVCSLMVKPEFLKGDISEEKAEREVLSIVFEGSRLLRSMTMFDRYLRSLIEEIPKGSGGCLLLAKEDESVLRKFLTWIEDKDRKMGQDVQGNLIGIVSHMSECPKGARLLQKMGVVEILLPRLGLRVEKDVRKNSLVTVCNVLNFTDDQAEREKNIKLASNPRLLLRILSCFVQNADGKTQEGVLRIITLVVAHYHDIQKKAAEEGQEDEFVEVRENIAKVFVQQRANSVGLFQLINHRRLLMRRSASKLIGIVTKEIEIQPKEGTKRNITFSETYFNSMKMIKLESEQAAQKAQLMKQKREAQFQQMMRMQAMGINPMAMGGGNPMAGKAKGFM